MEAQTWNLDDMKTKIKRRSISTACSLALAKSPKPKAKPISPREDGKEGARGTDQAGPDGATAALDQLRRWRRRQLGEGEQEGGGEARGRMAQEHMGPGGEGTYLAYNTTSLAP